MVAETATPACPHCGVLMLKWGVPDQSTWDTEFLYVCFNDDCSYYKEGWEWMKQQYNQRASYRHAVNPTSGGVLPLPVWSDSATLEMIVDDAEGEGE